MKKYTKKKNNISYIPFTTNEFTSIPFTPNSNKFLIASNASGHSLNTSLYANDAPFSIKSRCCNFAKNKLIFGVRFLFDIDIKIGIASCTRSISFKQTAKRYFISVSVKHSYVFSIDVIKGFFCFNKHFFACNT